MGMVERKLYTEEFKIEAVRLAKERGNIAQTARDLGISDNTLQGWKLQMARTPKHPFPGNGNPRDEEMVKLQRENACLKEEVEILKKAVGIFTNRPRCQCACAYEIPIHPEMGGAVLARVALSNDGCLAEHVHAGVNGLLRLEEATRERQKTSQCSSYRGD